GWIEIIFAESAARWPHWLFRLRIRRSKPPREQAAATAPHHVPDGRSNDGSTEGPRSSCVIFVLLSAFTVCRPMHPSTRLIVLAVAVGTIGCSTGKTGLVLTDQLEARRLGADIRVQFTMAADAANRAVMADTDETSKDAAQEAMKSR